MVCRYSFKVRERVTMKSAHVISWSQKWWERKEKIVILFSTRGTPDASTQPNPSIHILDAPHSFHQLLLLTTDKKDTPTKATLLVLFLWPIPYHPPFLPTSSSQSLRDFSSWLLQYGIFEDSCCHCSSCYYLLRHVNRHTTVNRSNLYSCQRQRLIHGVWRRHHSSITRHL